MREWQERILKKIEPRKIYDMNDAKAFTKAMNGSFCAALANESIDFFSILKSVKEDLLDNDVLMFKRANNASLYSALAEYAKKDKDFVSLLKKAKNECYENDTAAFVAQVLNSQCTALAKQGDAFIEGLKERRQQQLGEKEKLKPRQPVSRRLPLNNNNNNNNNKNILP